MCSILSSAAIVPEEDIQMKSYLQSGFITGCLQDSTTGINLPRIPARAGEEGCDCWVGAAAREPFTISMKLRRAAELVGDPSGGLRCRVYPLLESPVINAPLAAAWLRCRDCMGRKP